MTRRWWTTTEPLYRRFAPDCFEGRDAREAREMFMAETFGGRQPDPATNRYAAGKRTMDATVSMWREDIGAGLLMKFEILEDPTMRGIGRWINRTLARIMPGENIMARSLT